MASNPAAVGSIAALDPAWPRVSVAEAKRLLTQPGSRFEMDMATINGVPTRVWKNAPPSLPWLIDAARAHGDRLFLVYEDERVGYATAVRAVAALAKQLEALGIGKGDRVALAMRNLPEWPIIFFAITALGAIAVPLNAWWTGPELDYGLRDSGSRLLIADAERHARLAPLYAGLPALEKVIVARSSGPLETGVERLEDMIGPSSAWPDLLEQSFPDVAIAPDDPAAILYTSGTTGAPKGALVSHRNFMTNILSGGFATARAFVRRGEAVPEPSPRVMMTVVPLFHATALSAALMGSIAAGFTTVLCHHWDPEREMEIIEREKVNITGGVPTIARQLLEHPERHRFDLSSLESIGYGGAPSAPELVRRLHAEFGVLPTNGWGMTETTATVTTHGSEDYLNRPTSAGPPVAVADIEVRAEDGVTVLATGEIGELWARGPMIVKEYWNKPEATAVTFVDGWVRTGDLARIDDEGFLFIIDRAKDMIIRGGENIYSTEVENVLYDHPAVTDAALVGIPIARWARNRRPSSILPPGASASEAELQGWVRERLASFKVPVAIRFMVQTLPRNANGKILKRELVGLFEQA